MVRLTVLGAIICMCALGSSIGSQEPISSAQPVEVAQIEQDAILAHRSLFNVELATMHGHFRREGPCNWCHCGNCDQIAEARAECNMHFAELRLKRIKGHVCPNCDKCPDDCQSGCECKVVDDYVPPGWPEGKPVPASMKPMVHVAKRCGPVERLVESPAQPVIQQALMMQDCGSCGSGGCGVGGCCGRRGRR